MLPAVQHALKLSDKGWCLKSSMQSFMKRTTLPLYLSLSKTLLLSDHHREREDANVWGILDSSFTLKII